MSEATEQGVYHFASDHKRPRSGLLKHEASGDWFVYPCPVHWIMPFYEGIRILRYHAKFPDRKRREWLVSFHWNDLKQRCADCLKADIVDAVDRRIAQLETQIDTWKVDEWKPIPSLGAINV